MAKLETVARLLGWQITKYGVRRMERKGAFDAALPAYDTDANASRELLAYVAKEDMHLVFSKNCDEILRAENPWPGVTDFARYNATPQQIYAAFCATFAHELTELEKQL